MATTTAPDLGRSRPGSRRPGRAATTRRSAATIPIISEQLCDAADLRAGWRVLDVAGGSGNTALAAARCGCDVVSIDYVPSLLARARERAAAEGLDVEPIEGDAEALPFPDASFDAVVSVVGVMFAPDHERDRRRAPARLPARAARSRWPTGRPDGFIGRLFATVRRHVPPPAGLTPPPLWGTEEHVRALLGDGVQRRCGPRAGPTPSASARRSTSWSSSASTTAPRSRPSPPSTRTGSGALAEDIADLVRRFDRLGGDGPVAIPAGLPRGRRHPHLRRRPPTAHARAGDETPKAAACTRGFRTSIPAATYSPASLHSEYHRRGEA